MTPDVLLIALAEAGVRLVPEGDALRFEAPSGVMTTTLAAAISQHKMIVLFAFKTAGKSRYDEHWEIIRAWIADDAKRGPVPLEVIAAGKRVGFPYEAREWPPQYAERLKMALRCRALLAVFNDSQPAPTVIEPAPATDHVTADVA